MIKVIKIAIVVINQSYDHCNGDGSLALRTTDSSDDTQTGLHTDGHTVSCCCIAPSLLVGLLPDVHAEPDINMLRTVERHTDSHC